MARGSAARAARADAAAGQTTATQQRATRRHVKGAHPVDPRSPPTDTKTSASLVVAPAPASGDHSSATRGSAVAAAADSPMATTAGIAADGRLRPGLEGGARGDELAAGEGEGAVVVPPESACSAARDGRNRCWGWSHTLPLHYHDNVWGRPVRDDSTALFGNMCLQLFQTGLNWGTVLRKEAELRRAFCNFEPERVAAFDEADVARLLANEGIIRHQGKIRAVINNARVVHSMESAAPGGFAAFVWEHAPASPKESLLASGKHLQSHMRTDFTTKAEDRLESDGVHPTRSVALFTKACKRAGFKHVGETTLLSFFQAVGVMNHHTRACFAFHEIEAAKVQGDHDTAASVASAQGSASAEAVSATDGPTAKRARVVANTQPKRPRVQRSKGSQAAKSHL